MADFKIKVGASTNSTDISAFAKDIKSIIKAVEKSSPPLISLSVNEGKTRTNFVHSINKIIKSLKIEPIEIKFKETQIDGKKKKVAQKSSTKADKGAYISDKELSDIGSQISNWDIQSASIAAKRQLLNDPNAGIITDAENALTEALAKLNTAYDNIINKKNQNVALTEDEIKTLREANAEYKASRQAYQNSIQTQKETEIVIEKSRNAYNKLIKLRNDFERFGNANNVLFTNDALATKYEELRDELKLTQKLYSSDGKANVDAVNDLNDKVSLFKSKVLNAGKTGQTVFTKLGQQVQKLGVYFASMLSLGMFLNQLHQITATVKELDTAITNLQIATGGTRNDTRELLQTYSSMGKELGATTSEVADAADAWLRQGNSIQDANILIRDSMMLSKLGQIDSAEATKALTSAMKGYNVEVQNAEGIVDKLTSIDMKAAVSAGELATAMAETANSAKLAGVDMDKLLGYLAAVKETTQDDAGSVGNFAKTMFARMGNVKAGNLYDAESAESLSDVETVLSGLGIKLRDSKSEFRNFGDVLDEVADKWNNYSSVNKKAIAVAFAGTRQQEKFLVLMDKYSEAMDYAEVAANSAGTAQQKYQEAYESSIQAAQNASQASFEEFSRAALDDSWIKFYYNGLSGVLSLFTQLANFFNGNVAGQIIRNTTLITAAMSGLSAAQKSLAATGFVKKLFGGAETVGEPYEMVLLIRPLCHVGDNERVYSIMAL